MTLENSGALSDGDLKGLQGFLLARIYHEDQLFTQRVYNYLMIHVVLSAVFAVVFLQAINNDEEPFITLLAIAIGLVGVVLALMQSALAKRTRVAISVFREYLKGVEGRLSTKIDTPLFEFYQKGKVTTSVGTLSLKDDGCAVYNVLPWKIGWLKSTNDLLGVGFPYLLATFWLFGLFLLAAEQTPNFLRCLGMIGVGLVFVAVTFVLWFRGPARAALQECSNPTSLG